MTGYSHHLPEVNSHFTAVLQDSPDEEGCPGREAALVSIHTLSQQHLINLLKVKTRHK